MKTTKILFPALLSCLLQLLSSVHSETGDPFTSLQESLEKYTNIISEISNLEQLSVEYAIRAKKHLAEVLAYNGNSNNIEKISEEINRERSIKTVDEIISNSKLPALPGIIWSIYKDNDAISFEIMAWLQLKLYDNEFIRNFAGILYKIQHEDLFKTTNPKLKLRVESTAYQLPKVLRSLFFKNQFRLRNDFKYTLIYTADKNVQDGQSREIWICKCDSDLDDAANIETEVAELDENGLKVLLKGILHQTYYYIDPENGNIAGWDSAKKRDSSLDLAWKVEFLENGSLAFSQNDNLMCVVDPIDDKRYNVVGIARQYSVWFGCEWSLEPL